MSNGWLSRGPAVCRMFQHRERGKLKGILMLVVGEMDDNVPPESTYLFVDALIRAGKDLIFCSSRMEVMAPVAPYGQRRAPS